MARAQATTETLSTAAVSALSGYSLQQVRDLEAQGVIPPAPRAANGYRQFSRHHVRGLRAYRELSTAVGPVRARHTMRQVRALPRNQAVALVSALHTSLNAERDEALAAQRALRMIHDEAALDVDTAAEDSMSITELAGALSVRASTLRFWEQVGLVQPERITTRAGTARRYPLPAIREARITAALRAAGYRIPDVQRSIAAIRHLSGIDEPLAVLDSRVDAIAQRALALLRRRHALGDHRQPTRPAVTGALRALASPAPEPV